jgi:hypothetical protein
VAAGHPAARRRDVQDDEAAGTVHVERMVHGMVGVHLVDEAQLDLVADAELPVDEPCHLPTRSFQPPCGRGGRGRGRLVMVVVSLIVVLMIVAVGPEPDHDAGQHPLESDR